jgi:cation diffusion facilitator CzcD-associated flavoprotein CzcO
MRQIDEPARAIDVVHETDVLVVGSGPGGLAAALALSGGAAALQAQEGNACPNYWHFSPYGFCPYDCEYCYCKRFPQSEQAQMAKKKLEAVK